MSIHYNEGHFWNCGVEVDSRDGYRTARIHSCPNVRGSCEYREAEGSQTQHPIKHSLWQYDDAGNPWSSGAIRWAWVCDFVLGTPKCQAPQDYDLEEGFNTLEGEGWIAGKDEGIPEFWGVSLTK